LYQRDVTEEKAPVNLSGSGSDRMLPAFSRPAQMNFLEVYPVCGRILVGPAHRALQEDSCRIRAIGFR
jgi:hypothetical protein